MQLKSRKVHMRKPTINVFAGLKPADIETFTAQVRMRYYQYVRLAIQSADEPERRERFLGVAEGMVCTLYDINTEDAHVKLTHLERLINIFKSRDEEK